MLKISLIILNLPVKEHVKSCIPADDWLLYYEAVQCSNTGVTEGTENAHAT